MAFVVDVDVELLSGGGRRRCCVNRCGLSCCRNRRRCSVDELVVLVEDELDDVVVELTGVAV